ncbi:hypothetical protein [Amycolatopsis orientalis]|uniref:hypothetical protein n=1 Tax=Amycolatopsis orientalis TaxID=31958 RepID=UPI000415CDAD|nr:hypothetical protein [Amycolatopsis orientalis]
MSRHIDLPSTEEVLARLGTLRAEPGTRVSVLALARAVGLSNTTFRRHFPAIVDDLVTGLPTSSTPARPSHTDDRSSEILRLRREILDLRAQLDVACAQIQHLALVNERLRNELHAALSVHRVRPRA